MEAAWTGEVERISWGGLGIGRDADGRVILLSSPLALFPGEEVEAQVRWKARHGEGEVRRWIRKDARRVPALCPAAGECGGCALWESGDQASDLKRQMAEDLFRRQLPTHPPFRWVPAPDWARRHRIQLHWDGRTLGFHARGSHRIVPVETCPAAAEPLAAAIPALRDALLSGALPGHPQRWELATGSPAETVLAVDETRAAWQLSSGRWTPTRSPILHRKGDLALRHGAGAFFQVCAPWAMEAFGGLMEAWDLRGATLFDLYGGVGLFSALLGGRFARRVLVEGNGDAVAWAERNLADLGLPSECLAEDVARWLPERLGQRDDLILLDPPRTGLAPSVAEKLLTAGAGSLVLVGCDGAAFCRDVKRLESSWRVTALAVLDLFPLTPHMECVALFRRSVEGSC